MERADIKRVLKEMGVAEALLEMPAVIEPIYKEMMEKAESELRKQGRVNVDEHGNFSFYGKKIKLNENGGAEITFADAKILTNPEGIEITYEEGSNIDWFSAISRENGLVKNISGNNGNASYYESTHLDTGSWAVRSASGIAIREHSSTEKDPDYIPFQGNVEEVIKDFDTFSGVVIAEYPQTESWYKTTREKMKQIAEIEADPQEQIKRKIETLEKRVANLENDKRDLLNRNASLAAMLEKSLDFMGQVKRSPIGKVFFAKGLKKYEEESKGLPCGRDDR